LGEDSFWPVALDAEGRLSLKALEARIEEARLAGRPVLMVVSVAGTTELGVLDPVHEVQDLLDRYRGEQGVDIWHHVDAAYGGFLCSLEGEGGAVLKPRQMESLRGIRRANSVTLDPHKLGYVPYSCGAYIARDARDWLTRSFDGPYLQFDPKRDKGQHTLEGSRSAAGAAATWMTAQSIGLNGEGYGRILARTISTKRMLEGRLQSAGLPLQLAPSTDSNILAFCVAAPGETTSRANARTEVLLSALGSIEKDGFHASHTRLSWEGYEAYLDRFVGEWKGVRDSSDLVLVRLCMMNPFFGSREMSVDFPELLIGKIRESVGG
jgi:glutamate/tyrosine decarboxylase-like PLP-dependent enzyme